MKKYNNHIFLGMENDINSVIADVSDGYLKGFGQNEGKRIKLPHSNYTLLGIVQECIDSPYAEEFSKDIVKYVRNVGDGYGGYWNYHLEAWGAEFDTAVESMKTLIEKLDLKLTDYILRDENTQKSNG